MFPITLLSFEAEMLSSVFFLLLARVVASRHCEPDTIGGITRSDPTYDTARAQFASAIHPVVIVYCTDDTDVLSTLAFATRCNYKVSVRSGMRVTRLVSTGPGRLSAGDPPHRRYRVGLIMEPGNRSVDWYVGSETVVSLRFQSPGMHGDWIFRTKPFQIGGSGTIAFPADTQAHHQRKSRFLPCIAMETVHRRFVPRTSSVHGSTFDSCSYR